MKFYIVGNDMGVVQGCTTTLREAKQMFKQRCDSTGSITMVEVPVTAESVRLLLGEQGGYAIDSKDIV